MSLRSPVAMTAPLPEFVRAERRFVALSADPAGSRLADDVRLFATTFAAGFLFVALFLA